MPRTVTLVDFTELLHYAQKIGISWNTAHDILVKAEIPPMYESNSREYDFTDFVSKKPDYQGAYGHPDEVIRIMAGFMVDENLSGFTLVND
jgi:hypothetical protein